MTDLAFGLVTGATAGAVAELEDLPIASLWVGGHVASPNPTPEAIVGLARVAAIVRGNAERLFRFVAATPPIDSPAAPE